MPVCPLHVQHLCDAPCAGSSFSKQALEAHKQIEAALQAAEQQVTALKTRVTKKHLQLADARHELEVTRGELCDVCATHHKAPPSLPDTESSDQTGMCPCTVIQTTFSCVHACLYCKAAMMNSRGKYPLFACRCSLLYTAVYCASSVALGTQHYAYI